MISTMNPIIARELKERMRSLRAPVVLTIYLLLLGLIVFAVERTAANDSGFGFARAAAGRMVFHWLLFFLLLFICFLVPAFTSPAIASERERQTFHLVQVTLLSPAQIVLGKLGAAFAWLVLLVVATIPLVAVSFTLGGVTPLDVLRGYAMVLLVGLVIAMVGVAVSARLRRAMGATVLTFTLVLGLTVGTWMAFGLVKVWQSRDEFGNFRDTRDPTWTLVLNPFVGTASAIQGKSAGGGETPFEALFSFMRNADRPIEDQTIQIGPGGAPRPAPAPAPPKPRDRLVPFWVWSVIWSVGLFLVCFSIAVAGVRAPTMVFRTGRRRKRAAAVA